MTSWSAFLLVVGYCTTVVALAAAVGSLLSWLVNRLWPMEPIPPRWPSYEDRS